MADLRAAVPRLPQEEDVVSVTLRDGGVGLLRPLERGEQGPLLAVFDAMSPASRALRYLTGLPRLPGSLLSLLTDVDGDRHAAWLVSVDGAPAGVGRFVRSPDDPTTAELAFEVVDHQHGRGLATVLLDAVTTAASARGVRRLQATMAPRNTAARHLLERVGAPSRLLDGLLEAEGPLRLLDPPVVDRTAVVRLTCAASWDAALDIG